MRQQIYHRDLELERLIPRKPVPPFVDPPVPSEAELAEWSGRVKEADGLRASGFFSAANWKHLHHLLVVVATGAVNHASRARLHLNSWIRLMPNASRSVLFSSDSQDPSLAPVPVLALPNDEPARGGFQASVKPRVKERF